MYVYITFHSTCKASSKQWALFNFDLDPSLKTDLDTKSISSRFTKIFKKKKSFKIAIFMLNLTEQFRLWEIAKLTIEILLQ